MAETTITQPDDMIPNSFDKRILVVDDVPLVCTVVAKYLKTAGFENVALETNPHLVMDMISEFKPDMVLLDILMPEISGIEILKKIRSNPDMDQIIVLMLSAAGRDDQFESLELGALGFMQKPITAVDLVQTVTGKFCLAKRLGIQ